MKLRVILPESNRSFRDAKSSSGNIADLHQLAIELTAIEIGRVSPRLDVFKNTIVISSLVSKI